MGFVDYKGTNYAGWQVQPNATSVQEKIEESLSTFYKEKISVVGCGRTDAGVHARNYAFHFDMTSTYDTLNLQRINAILPEDIALKNIVQVTSDFHARYSCNQRTYHYHLHGTKDPFLRGFSYCYPLYEQLDWEKIHQVSQLLLNFEEFYSFCKSRSSADHYKCQLSQVEWIHHDQKAQLIISSNRFLRGMVRLVVGMQLHVGSGKMKVDDVAQALQNQERLPMPWAVPPEGLFLVNVNYPPID